MGDEDKLDNILLEIAEIKGDIKYIKGNLGILNRVLWGAGSITGTIILIAILAIVLI